MKNLIIYMCIATMNACVWSFLAVLVGLSSERAIGAFALAWFLTYAILLFMAGCAVASRPPYYLDV